MKAKKIISKLGLLGLLSIMLVTTTNAETARAEISVNQEVDDVIVNVELNDADRVVSLIDVAKVIFTQNTLELDFKPNNLKPSILEIAPELKLADIMEYEGTELQNRKPLTVHKDSSSTYAGQLQYLLDNNLITRDTYYMYDNSGVYVSQRRLPNPQNSNQTPSAQNKNNTHKYFNEDLPVAKSDFLMQLMKTNEVITSKPILVQSPYTRINENLERQAVKYEPVETSPYTSYMGQLGIDQNAHDVIINHDVFKQTEVVVTSDVMESYLSKALSMNIISSTELGGTEGNRLLTTYNNKRLNDGWKNTSIPARQFYTKAELSPKLFGRDIIYQLDQYNKYIEDQTKLDTNESCVDTGITPIWGDSYSYNTTPCAMANPYTNKATEIVKRPSCVEVTNGFVGMNKDKGYQYFKEEEMTLSQAYVMTYNFLMSIGYEPTVVNPEYISSMFALNLNGFTEEERKATEYLISVGIVNGNDKELANAPAIQLTNRHMVDITYRVDNPDARYELKGELSATDREMASRGFAKADITVSDKPSQKLDMYYKNSDNPNDTYYDVQIDDRTKNPFQYDMIYVRIPKSITDKVYGENPDGYVNLVTNNATRTKIDPINDRALNGGIEGLEHKPNDLLDTEKLYDTSGRYVYLDRDGYMWQRFFVHKDLSNKVLLTSFSNGGTTTFTGISGEGVYYIEEGSTSGQFIKVPLSEASKHPVASKVYNNLIEFDLSTRSKLQLQQTTTENLAKDFNTDKRTLLWAQSYYANPVDKTTRMTAVFGPIAESAMETVTYKGKPMFKKSANSANNAATKGWEFADDLPMDADVREGYDLKYNPATQMYELNYTAMSQNEIGALVELSFINVGAKPTEEKATTGGYAKILANGEDLVLISEKELGFYGIERAKDASGGLSDKSLFNPKTGQRAFLDTDLNVTLIGNNITQYPAEHMMVYSLGEELYYNLDIIMELLNDSSTVYQRTGKSIVVSKSSMADTPDKFRLTEVKDVLLGGSGNAPVIDRTYILDSSNNTYYMNLSALTGSASNFLFYKNRDGLNDFDALIVYEPNVKSGQVNHTPTGKNNGVSSFTDNGIITNTNQAQSGIAGQFSDSEHTNVAKQLIFDKLFGMGKNIGSQILYGDYNVDVYLLNSTPSAGSHKELINKFLSFVTENDQTMYNTLLGNIVYDADKLGLPKVDSKVDKNSGVVKLDYLPLAISKGQTENFLLHQDTGNLYYKITANGKPNHRALQDIVKQRFYFDPNSKVITIRRKQYYENTPKDYIPLEIYGKPNSRDFGALESTENGIVNYNFPKQKYKLTLPSNDMNKGDANIRIPIDEEGVQDFGLATNVELPFQALDAKTLQDFAKSSKDVFAEKFFMKNVNDFTQGTTNNYPARSAMGDIDNHNVVTVGYANDLSAESKLKFVSGNWAGLNGSSSAFYVPQICKSCNHKKHYVMTTGEDLLGKTPVNPKAKFYLHELSPTGINADEGTYTVTKTHEVVKYNDIPNDVREIISKAKKDEKVSLPVYYKPSLSIPAGTTLVDLNGNLVYQPNPDIREPLNHSVDIINNMLARQQELMNLSGVSMLSQTNMYSLVEIGDRFFIKLGKPEDVVENSKDRMKWVPALMIPKTTTDGSYPLIDEKNINEAFLMENVLSDLGSVTLPTQNGIKEVTLLEILGPSQFRLPFLEEVKGAKEVHDSKYIGMPNTLMLDTLNTFFLMEQSPATEVKGVNKYTTNAYKSKVSKGKLGMKDTKKATLSLVVYLPPTIQVEEKVGASDHYKTYKAISYWDINAFNVDPDNGAVNILMEHDTDAESIQGLLDNMRKSGLDGTYFTKYSLSKFIEFLYEFGVTFLLRGIPVIISLVWLLICVLTVVFWFPYTKAWGDRINRRFGADVISKATFGVVDVHDENPNLVKFMIASACLWGLIFVLWDGYILRLVITMFVGDSDVIQTIQSAIHSILPWN